MGQGTSCAAREQLRSYGLPGRMAGSTSASPAALRGAGAGQKSHSASVVPSGVRYQVPQPQAAAQTTRARPPPQEFTGAGAISHSSLQRRPTAAHSTPPGSSHSSIMQQHQQDTRPPRSASTFNSVGNGQPQLRGQQQVPCRQQLPGERLRQSQAAAQAQENALQQLGVHYHLPHFAAAPVLQPRSEEEQPRSRGGTTAAKTTVTMM